ncbi:MAG: hypothetical protein K2X95_08110 [Flavobacteriaceae bacterium]|nr:hypothetical protein [Flavobacteriaceae bacterium]
MPKSRVAAVMLGCDTHAEHECISISIIYSNCERHSAFQLSIPIAKAFPPSNLPLQIVFALQAQL